jgi:hypothetical protein
MKAIRSPENIIAKKTIITLDLKRIFFFTSVYLFKITYAVINGNNLDKNDPETI